MLPITFSFSKKYGRIISVLDIAFVEMTEGELSSRQRPIVDRVELLCWKYCKKFFALQFYNSFQAVMLRTEHVQYRYSFPDIFYSLPSKTCTEVTIMFLL